MPRSSGLDRNLDLIIDVFIVEKWPRGWWKGSFSKFMNMCGSTLIKTKTDDHMSQGARERQPEDVVFDMVYWQWSELNSGRRPFIV